jgi:hypothetical protein
MMGIFNKKQEVTIEDFCRDFYEKNILNPVIHGVDAGMVYFDVARKSIVEADQNFSKITSQKLASEVIPLRFELFALAWTHKFISGKNVVAQSAFTKRYLLEKGRKDIWDGMDDYSKAIDGATLHWLTSLGKMNLSFNYHVREDLAAENIEEAKKLGIDIDESVERVNYRLWSENAWRQKIILTVIQSVFYKKLRLNPDELNDEALFRIAVIIKGLYDGARQSIDRIKIRD